MSIIYEPAGRAREYSPLACNLFAGCVHRCTYCFAPSALRRDALSFHSSAAPRADILRRLAKEAATRQGPRQSVLLCFTCDPYQPIEVEAGITRQAIEILHRHDWPVEILTKGGTRASRDFDLLGPQDAFASTLTFLDAERSREWEPDAASPDDRITAIKDAHARGIPTWVSLEPVIDPRESLAIIEATHPFVDLYKVGKLNYHATPSPVDWGAFATEAVALLGRLGKRYYIKADLRAFMSQAASGF